MSKLMKTSIPRVRFALFGAVLALVAAARLYIGKTPAETATAPTPATTSSSTPSEAMRPFDQDFQAAMQRDARAATSKR